MSTDLHPQNCPSKGIVEGVAGGAQGGTPSGSAPSGSAPSGGAPCGSSLSSGSPFDGAKLEKEMNV